MIAEVIINSNVRNLNRIFDYQIPNNLDGEVVIGSSVLVPFGNGKKWEEGYVVGIKSTSSYQVKEIAALHPEHNVEEKRIELAKWMARRYFCNVADCLRMMIPPGTDWKNKKTIKEKNIKCVYLKQGKEQIRFAIENTIKSLKQKRVLEFLIQNEGIAVSDLQSYTEVSLSILKTLEKNQYIKLVNEKIDRSPIAYKKTIRTQKWNLMQEQQMAYTRISEAISKKENKIFLLHGVTGSGKTEVYLQLIERVINQGMSAIVLVPEIALTPQILDRFISRFGKEEIAVLHSKLSLGERFDEWNRIKEGKANIIIGARSAIMAPVQKLGMIIVDEEQDSSYQSEMTPRYHAKEVAEFLSKQYQIPLLLGSATPDISTFYKAQKGEITLLSLTKRANDATLPHVEIVDLREELASGNRSMISRKLYQEITTNLKDKKQTILFLNRRGFSTFIMCRDCGYTAKCKNCNISLTYHKKENILKCHYCGFTSRILTACPECGSSKIRYFGTGTQKLEEQIKEVFPNASTIRMDIDTITKKNSHEEILNRFQSEGIDILIRYTNGSKRTSFSQCNISRSYCCRWKFKYG